MACAKRFGAPRCAEGARSHAGVAAVHAPVKGTGSSSYPFEVPAAEACGSVASAKRREVDRGCSDARAVPSPRPRGRTRAAPRFGNAYLRSRQLQPFFPAGRRAAVVHFGHRYHEPCSRACTRCARRARCRSPRTLPTTRQPRGPGNALPTRMSPALQGGFAMDSIERLGHWRRELPAEGAPGDEWPLVPRAATP